MFWTILTSLCTALGLLFFYILPALTKASGRSPAPQAASFVVGVIFFGVTVLFALFTGYAYDFFGVIGITIGFVLGVWYFALATWPDLPKRYVEWRSRSGGGGGPHTPRPA
ncbi:MAG: hypothetical protein HY455_02300 [Parcubacteria group bacterium]|nr:hypothetical protein [Parcubacteria group bacterium]